MPLHKTYILILGYVEHMKKLLFTLPSDSMNKILREHKEKVPKPLNTKFPDRRSKDEAIIIYNTRKDKTPNL